MGYPCLCLWFVLVPCLGFGSSFIIYAINVVITLYFEKYLAMANSLFSIGSSVGEMAMTPATQLMIEETGLRKCFMIIAGLHLVPCLLSLTFDPSVAPQRTNQKQEQEPAKSLKKNYMLVCRNLKVMCFILGCFFYENGSFVTRMFMV